MKCKKCGAVMFVNNNIVFTSNPPQYQLYCPKCGHTEFAYYENITLEDLGNRIACQDCEQKDQQIAELKKQLVQSRENLTQCEADRRFEQEKKNIAMKRVNELTKQLALTEKAFDLMSIVLCTGARDDLKRQLGKFTLRKEVKQFFLEQAKKEIENETDN